MFIKFEKREQGRYFTYFTKEKEINGEKVRNTDKCVFGTLSEGIKTGVNNGSPIWENDYWNTTFCGKAYEKALELENNTRIVVTEMNIRNKYSKETKKSYPQIMVTDFSIIENDVTAIDNGELPFQD